MAEELARPKELRRNDGPVGFQPRENDLTFEQTPYVLTTLALAVDRCRDGRTSTGELRDSCGLDLPEQVWRALGSC